MVKILHVSPNLFIPPLRWDLILSYLSRECFGPNTSFAMPRKSRAMLSFFRPFQSDNMTMRYTFTMITPKIKSKLWLMNVISIHPSLYSISNENVRGIYKLTTWYACPCVAASIYSKNKNVCVSHFRVNMVVWTNRQEFLAWFLSTKNQMHSIPALFLPKTTAFHWTVN